MRNKLFAVLLCCLTLLYCVCGVSVYARNNDNTVHRAQGLMDGIVSYQQAISGSESVQEWINGALTDGAGIGAEWYIIALAQSGEYDFSRYEVALLEYLERNEVYSASTRQKYALCLSAVGSTDGYISSVLTDSIGKQGIMSLVYGLHLLNNGYSGDITSRETVEKLLSLQCGDGGWSLTGQTGDVDVTAMTVQALSVYYNTDDAVKSATDRALAFLSERQQTDGDYASYGVSNPESTAQVLVALCSLGVDCGSDQRFIKNGNTLIDGMEKYRLADGSFCHKTGGESNANATEQVFYASAAYIRMANGKGPLYILDRGDPENVQPAPKMDTDDKKADSAPGTGTDDKNKWGNGYKLWTCLIIIAVGGVICVILFLLKKRNIKNFIAVLVVTAVAVTLVCVTDLRSADEYYNGEDITKTDIIGTVTFTIRCDTVAGKTESEHIPEDGVILDTVSFDIEKGETVYDILVEAARKYNIHIENNGSADMAYIAGINYLYEYDHGDLSGWVYHVNGVSPSVGCGEYELADGDVIEWLYTCELGNDLK
ncbi:MAG: DUF4430 domain-containing protein [Clostridia bacterium]|nr:DUF4430 domain-containing protein [Clostridia bacterium]